MYTINGEIIHSAKGSTWKKHLYTAKKNIEGKIRYIYDANGADEKAERAGEEADKYMDEYDEYNSKVAANKRSQKHLQSYANMQRKQANRFKKTAEDHKTQADKYQSTADNAQKFLENERKTRGNKKYVWYDENFRKQAAVIKINNTNLASSERAKRKQAIDKANNANVKASNALSKSTLKLQEEKRNEINAKQAFEKYESSKKAQEAYQKAYNKSIKGMTEKQKKKLMAILNSIGAIKIK